MLCYDALLEIVSFLSLKDLARLARVSKGTRRIVEDPVVWRRLCLQIEGDWKKVVVSPQLFAPIRMEGSWKDTYRNGMYWETEREDQFTYQISLFSISSSNIFDRAPPLYKYLEVPRFVERKVVRRTRPPIDTHRNWWQIHLCYLQEEQVFGEIPFVW